MTLMEINDLLSQNPDNKEILFAILDRLIELEVISMEEAESIRKEKHAFTDVGYHTPRYECRNCEESETPANINEKCTRAIYHSTRYLINTIAKMLMRWNEVKAIVEDYNRLSRLFK